MPSASACIVVCFEVLEHLPEPEQAIRDIATMVKPAGIALITEDFGDIAEHLPTHLKSTSSLAGTTPFLFLKSRMVLSLDSHRPPFKPVEFQKVDCVLAAHRWRLLRDRLVRGEFLRRYLCSVTRRLDKLAYLGR